MVDVTYTNRAGAAYTNRAGEPYGYATTAEAAAAYVAEKYKSRQFGVRSGSVVYFVYGTDDPVEAEALLDASDEVATSFGSLFLGGISSLRLVAPFLWEAELSYGADEVDPSDPEPGGELTYQFELGTESVTIKHSRDTSIYGDGGHDFGGLIGVHGQGADRQVDGVAILAPTARFSYTFRAPNDWGELESALSDVEALVGTVNLRVFRGRPAGEVLFLGASGSQNFGGSYSWEITYNFARQRNEVEIEVGGGITVPTKGGWQYIWVHHKRVENTTEKTLDVAPDNAFVETVYRSADWSAMGQWVNG